GTGSGQKLGCHECGVQGHFRRECPKQKTNNNQGNQCGRNNAPARTERQLLAGRLNMLFRDRRAHAQTRLLMEAEARMSREAWTRAIDARVDHSLTGAGDSLAGTGRHFTGTC
nr:hypothetical protein [Tanacetum cinerariifolium]